MRIVDDLDLTPYNSYRISARCARAYFPETEADVLEVYERSSAPRRVLLGSGHNVILARPWYDDEFVIFNGNFSRTGVDDTTMIAEAGAFSKNMSEIALQHGLSGIEVFYDIPSSLGGAIVMNASSSGDGIQNVLEKVRYVDLEEMRVYEVGASEIGLDYRTSFFQDDDSKIILKAWLQLESAKPSDIWAKMEAIRERRWSKQPRNYPNAGSVFKRPPGRFVGPMIDELELKGLSVGGFHVSEKHGGFIVSHAPGTGAELLELIEAIRARVQAAYGVELDLEQRVIC